MDAYIKARELAQISYQDWVSHELFSFGWFLMLFVLAVAYIVWIKLVDKARIIQLLLLGSLASVGYFISDMVLFGYYGVAQYKISLTPLEPPIFIISVTLVPVAIMMVEQYTSSWKGYVLWSAICMAFFSFVLLPVYSLVGIFVLYHWSYIYHFLMLFTGSILVRVAFLWLAGIQKRQLAKKANP